MEPDALLALLAGGGGTVAVLGAGAWAYLRSRGRKKSSDETTAREDDGTGTGTAASATAVKERPAAPTWADTLSAPSAKSAERVDAPGADAPRADAPVGTAEAREPSASEASQTAPEQTAPAQPGAEQPGTEAPETTEPATDPSDVPFDQENPPQTSVVEEHLADGAPAADAQTAPPETAPADAPAEEEPAAGTLLDTPEAPAERMVRLRERLSRSGALGRGILTLLTRGSGVDEDTWDEIEETLLMADLGPDATDEMLENLRRRIQVLGTDDPEVVREALREELLALVNPDLDRRLAATRREAPDGVEVPSVLMMVGVNGTGKTTTVGKLARVLVAAERTVVLGAADTFRAASADQLQTWAERVGAEVVRGKEGADPASVAFDAVARGVETGVDAVLVDTAGRLHTKTGLMDELGKVKRVVEKKAEVDEVLLVIDATTGQNGLMQARVFKDVVDITGVVLTKLDGTAKGGIVFQVQHELGVPVKLVGLGEGADDLAPFTPEAFVNALLGT